MTQINTKLGIIKKTFEKFGDYEIKEYGKHIEILSGPPDKDRYHFIGKIRRDDYVCGSLHYDINRYGMHIPIKDKYKSKIKRFLEELDQQYKPYN